MLPDPTSSIQRYCDVGRYSKRTRVSYGDCGLTTKSDSFDEVSVEIAGLFEPSNSDLIGKLLENKLIKLMELRLAKLASIDSRNA